MLSRRDFSVKAVCAGVGSLFGMKVQAQEPKEPIAWMVKTTYRHGNEVKIYYQVYGCHQEYFDYLPREKGPAYEKTPNIHTAKEYAELVAKRYIERETVLLVQVDVLPVYEEPTFHWKDKE